MHVVKHDKDAVRSGREAFSTNEAETALIEEAAWRKRVPKAEFMREVVLREARAVADEPRPAA